MKIRCCRKPDKIFILHLENHDRPLIIYIHPRTIDPHHSRFSLGFKRKFKCYVNLHTTLKKIEWLCRNNNFVTMGEGIEIVKRETNTCEW
ncbi:MAG TPA: DUF3473 domain-containing protein [Smithella sp.]|nr:DUF3473 domain-containing protein [Smithella sp.]